ncbi:hypothetical protein ACJX0J_028598 [Zea mays]
MASKVHARQEWNHFVVRVIWIALGNQNPTCRLKKIHKKNNISFFRDNGIKYKTNNGQASQIISLRKRKRKPDLLKYHHLLDTSCQLE